MKNLTNTIQNLKNKGFFQIIFSTTITKIVSFASAIFLPRFLSTYDYGLYTYIENILGYIILINAIGMVNVTLKYCAVASSDEEKRTILNLTTIIGSTFDFIVFILWQIIFLNLNLEYQDARNYLLLLGLIPMFTFFFENYQAFLRGTFQNTKYMINAIIYSISLIALQIILTISFNIQGIIFAKYLILGLYTIFYFCFILRVNKKTKKQLIDLKKKIKEILKYGLNMMIGNLVSMLLVLNEIFIINKVFQNVELLAQYKVASYAIPIMLFITSSIITFILPYFSKHQKDISWIYKNFKKIMKYNTLAMIIIHFGLFIFANTFIKIVFGNEYLVATSMMRVLLFASLTQSVFRIIPGNILAVIGNEKYNLVVNIICLIIHFGVEYFFLMNFGAKFIGVGLIIAYLLSGILMCLKLISLKRKEEK